MATAKKSTAKTRQVKTEPYKSFRLSKRIKHQAAPLTSAFKLLKGSLRHLKKHKKIFFGIVVIYLLLTIVLVKGFGISSGVGELKTLLEEAGSLTTGFTLFAVLLTSSGSASTEEASLYQSILLIITSLAVIWVLRQTYAGHKVTVRDAFYKGMYPLVPFLLVLAVVGLQLTPLLIGSWLYGAVIGGGIAVTGIEQAVVWSIIGLMAVWTFYMLSSSVFALYISTLPDMTPMKALRSARELVRHRRWAVMRKILALPVLLIVLGAVIMVPLIIFATPLAEWTFFILNMAVLAVAHSYIYALYRELL